MEQYVRNEFVRTFGNGPDDPLIKAAMMNYWEEVLYPIVSREELIDLNNKLNGLLPDLGYKQMGYKKIYALVDLETKQSYIGQTGDLTVRIDRHSRCKKSHIGRAIIEKGIENLKVIEFGWYDSEYADEVEDSYIIKYNTHYPNGYNHYYGNSGIKFHTDDTKKLISEMTTKRYMRKEMK